MHSGIKREKIVIIIILIVSISLIIIFWPIVKYVVLVLFGNCKAKVDAVINKQKIIHYLEKNYNEKFKVIEYRGGEWELWSGRKDDILIARSKEDASYLFEVKIPAGREKYILDERNTYHYGNELKKKIEKEIISKNTYLETISYATISGENVNTTYFTTNKNEIKNILNKFCEDKKNDIVYQCVINKDTILDKSKCIDMLYAIYKYLWNTNCEVYFEIKIVSNQLYDSIKNSMQEDIDALGTGSSNINVYLNFSMNLKVERSYKEIKEHLDHYLNKEEFTNLINQQWTNKAQSK